MAIPKWTDERTAALTEFVGSESPVSYSTVVEAADQLETSPRSVASKLRKMGHEVESSCLLYTSPSPRDKRQSRMPSSA